MFKTIDHLGVAVAKIEPALETLKKAGPVIVGKEEVIPAFGVRAIMVATGDGIPIEFIEPTSDSSNVAKFIAQRGGATVAPIRVTDGCGERETLVGGGPDAFR